MKRQSRFRWVKRAPVASPDHGGRRWIQAALLPVLGAIVAFCFASPPVRGCGGTPPPFFCAKTYVFAKGVGNPNLPAAAGGVVTVDTLHFVNAMGLTGFCAPAFPATVSMVATLECEPDPGAGPFEFGPFPITEGFTEIPIDIPVPAGPPRLCVLEVTSTVSFADGTQISQTADQDVCLLPAAPDDPSKPVIEVELLSSPIGCAHAGDEQVFTFSVKNNDPDRIFDGVFEIESRNVADVPEVQSGQSDPGSGVYAVSDPGGGDNYPVALLTADCVDLPAEPHETGTMQESGSVVLLPKQKQVIEVKGRTWQLCADGSCCEGVFRVAGLLTGGEAVNACAGFIMAVDNGKPADFDCDENGRAVTSTSAGAGPEGPAAILNAVPDEAGGRTTPMRFTLNISAMDLLIDGVPISGGTSSFSGVTYADGGFIRNVAEFSFIEPQAPPDACIIMINEFIIDEQSTLDRFIEIHSLHHVEDAPNGFEDFSPFALGSVSVEPGGGGSPFSEQPFTFEFMHQISAIGVEAGTFDQVPMKKTSVQFEQVSEDRYRVTSEWTAIDPTGVGNLIGFDVQNDYRGFASPDEPCPADFDDDGIVGFSDLISLLSAWGMRIPQFDLNDDGIVGFADLVALLAVWGPCP